MTTNKSAATAIPAILAEFSSAVENGDAAAVTALYSED